MTIRFPHIRYRLILLAVGAGLVLAGSGCTTTHRVKVDALSRDDAAERISYRIRTNNPSIDEDTLRHKEAAGFVKTALSGRGLYEAPSEEMADMIIEIDYGIGPPKMVQRVHSEPIMRRVPGQTYQEVVVIGVNPQTGQPITAVRTYREPDREIMVGMRDYVTNHVVYEKFMRMGARENSPIVEGRPPPQVWLVDVSTEGESDDLRKHLPVLAAATIDYIDRETEGRVTVRLKADSPDVEFVRQGM